MDKEYNIIRPSHNKRKIEEAERWAREIDERLKEAEAYAIQLDKEHNIIRNLYTKKKEEDCLPIAKYDYGPAYGLYMTKRMKFA